MMMSGSRIRVIRAQSCHRFRDKNLYQLQTITNRQKSQNGKESYKLVDKSTKIIISCWLGQVDPSHKDQCVSYLDDCQFPEPSETVKPKWNDIMETPTSS